MVTDLGIWAIVVVLLLCMVSVSQLKCCPSNRLLLVRNRLACLTGTDSAIRTYHGGVYFIWPLLQEHEFLDLSPMKISVDLSEMTDESLREPTTYYFKACLNVDNEADLDRAGEQFWNYQHDEIAEELKQRIEEVVKRRSSSNPSRLNEERNQFLVDLEQALNRELLDHGFRLLTISHAS